MSSNLDLFPEADSQDQYLYSGSAPLADRLRPSSWEEYQGLEHFDPALIAQLKSGKGRAPSLVLWGPPGTGKTTFARLVGESFDYSFVEFSAVLGGVAEVRKIIAQARRSPRPTLLFVDEIHRFNKAQQDAFLPHVEKGIVTLIGATTENPSFYLNNALLSRVRVLPVVPLSLDSQLSVLERAEQELELTFDVQAREMLAKFAAGDARRLLNAAESLKEARATELGGQQVSKKELESFLSVGGVPFYDRNADEHYAMASAFIKSLRGADPDAALYWCFRMLEGGEDPRFVLRRMMIFASEDIGNADPRALQLAVAATEAFERVGLPEGRIPIAQCVTYLAMAPRSNASYAAMNDVLRTIKERPRDEVPSHIRNAPTELMKSMGYGEGYQYAHSHDDGYAQGQQYLPQGLEEKQFYFPTDRGYEGKAREYWKKIKGEK